MLSLGLVVALALGVGGFFLLAGGDESQPGESADDTTVEVVDDGTPVDGGAYSFSNATTTVDAAPGLRMEMSIEAPDGDVEMTALLDRRERRMSVEFTGDLDGQSAGTMRLIADEPAAMMYMSADLFETDVPWVGIDVSMFGDVMATGEWFEDPADMTELFVGTDPVDLGVETVDGETLKHYEVTLSIDDMLATDSASLDGFGTADLTVLDAITFDIWVDETSRLRRLTFDDDVLGETVSLDMHLEHIDAPVSIPLPAPNDVMSIDELIGAEFTDITD